MTAFHAEVHREFVRIRVVERTVPSISGNIIMYMLVKCWKKAGERWEGHPKSQPEKAEGEGKIMLRSRS
jgi:hypothetical protein